MSQKKDGRYVVSDGIQKRQSKTLRGADGASVAGIVLAVLAFFGVLTPEAAEGAGPLVDNVAAIAQNFSSVLLLLASAAAQLFRYLRLAIEEKK